MTEPDLNKEYERRRREYEKAYAAETASIAEAEIAKSIGDE